MMLSVDRAYYSAPITDFCTADLKTIFAEMAVRNDFDLTGTQREAWLEQARLLRDVLRPYAGAVYLEFTIPRMGRRVDALVIVGSVIFVVEFKVGEQTFRRADLDLDYALDLRNFHEGSHGAYVAPVLVATDARLSRPIVAGFPSRDRLFEPSRTNSAGLAETVATTLKLATGASLEVDAWARSGYKPTPTIIEAISFASGPPADATRYPEGLLHFPVSCPAFDSLWVVELREPHRPFSLADLRGALDAIGGRLSEMLANASSITLPLLGTGNQQLNPRDVARELLSALPRWAQNPRLRTVRVFTLELEHVAVLNRALDDREYSAGSSALVAACQDLSRRLERRNWNEPLRAALKDLVQIASAPDPSMQSIALEGRRIAEVVLRIGLVTAEEETAERQRADLATPHLQLLLAHGRSAAAGERVEASDAVMVLYAAMRVAEMTGAWT